MNTARTFRPLAAALLAAAAVARAESLRLSLEDCLRIGLERNTALQNARVDERIAEYRIREIRAQVLPHLSARANVTRIEETDAVEFGGQRIEMGRDTSYSAGVDVSQLLYDGGSVQAALQAAQTYRNLAAHEVERQAASLVREIRRGFHGLRIAEEAVALREASLRQWGRFVEQTGERVRRGDASEFDLASSRVRLANERPLLTEARMNRDLAREAFRNLVGLDSAEFELVGEDPPLPSLPCPEHLVRLGLMRRPELRLLERRAALQRAEIRVEQGGYLPEFRFRAGYEGRNPPGFGSAENEWDWGWSAAVNAEWRIFDGARRRSTIAALRLEEAKTLADLEDAERSVALQTRQAWRRLEHALDRLAAGDETVALAEKSLAIAQTRVEAGLSTALEYADSQLALDTARFQRLQARLDLRDAVAQLEFAAATESAEWTEEPDAP